MHQIKNKHNKFKSITLYGYRLFYFHKNMYLCNVNIKQLKIKNYE